MAELMGRNAYARHRGCAPNAVSKAIESGRISAAVVYDTAGKFVGINWEAADALWAMNTDPGEAAKNGKFYAAPVASVSMGAAGSGTGSAAAALTMAPAAPVAPGAPAASGALATRGGVTEGAKGDGVEHSGDVDAGAGESAGASPGINDDNAIYLSSRALKEQFAAKTAELEYRKAIGQLVDVAAVWRAVEDLLSQLRVDQRRIADRKAQILAAETDPARVHRILTNEIDGTLDECSRQCADAAAGRAEESASAGS